MTHTHTHKIPLIRTCQTLLCSGSFAEVDVVVVYNKDGSYTMQVPWSF